MPLVFNEKNHKFHDKLKLNCQNLRYNSYKYSDKWTKVAVNVGTCMGNNKVNF